MGKADETRREARSAVRAPTASNAIKAPSRGGEKMKCACERAVGRCDGVGWMGLTRVCVVVGVWECVGVG